jgi:aryl-alcohol dehydrogenase-like predicted oxidoreductase
MDADRDDALSRGGTPLRDVSQINRRRESSMRQVRLGQTNLQVSAIAFGTWAFGGDWGATDPQEGKNIIQHALELGINLFDTAQGYGFGVAEQLLADALRGRTKREDVVIATKGGLRMDGDRLLRDASRQSLRDGVESSLRNLGTDYIDIYHLHWPDLHTPPEETAEVLEELVGEGKIRHAGVSNYDADQMRALGRFGRVETLQPPYHLFRRDIEDAILPFTTEHDIGVLVYGPMAHGLLSGRMTESMTFDPDDWRSKSPDFAGETFRQNLAVVERLKGLARERGMSLPQLAVAWTLTNPAVDVAIVGARRPAQLEETASAADIEVSAADLQEIDAILADALPVWGPHPEGM